MFRKSIPRRAKLKYVSFFILSQFLFLILSAQVRITGNVTNAENKGIPDISVIIRNTTTGVVTDASGNYVLQADLRPGTYQLDFSGVGFRMVSQQVRVEASQSNYTANVQMNEDAMKMDEVVITGVSLGTTRRQLGNYISTVNADDLNKGATANVLTALQGKTAGAQIIQNSGAGPNLVGALFTSSFSRNWLIIIPVETLTSGAPERPRLVKIWMTPALALDP